MQDGRSNNNKGSDVTRSRAYVCVNSTKRKCVKSSGKNKGKKQSNSIRQTSRVQGEIQPAFLGKRILLRNDRNVDEATITKYIAEQYERDRLEGETS